MTWRSLDGGTAPLSAQPSAAAPSEYPATASRPSAVPPDRPVGDEIWGCAWCEGEGRETDDCDCRVWCGSERCEINEEDE